MIFHYSWMDESATVCVCVYAGETSANEVHATYIWNNFWLALLAATTSDYTSVPPKTHYGRYTILNPAPCSLHPVIITYQDLYLQTSRAPDRVPFTLEVQGNRSKRVPGEHGCMFEFVGMWQGGVCGADGARLRWPRTRGVHIQNLA